MSKLGILIVGLFVLSSCGKESDKVEAIQDSVVQPKDPQVRGQQDYALTANAKAIALKAWENEIQLDSLLGKPDSVSNRVLGDGADTHMGATIKSIVYPGLKLEIYVPKGKDTGWVMTMNASDSRHATSRGAKVGDSASRIKQLYPDGSVFPDGRNNKKRYAWYISDGSNYSTLKFEIESETVKQIDLYYEIP
jgi:hypothetical protein